MNVNSAVSLADKIQKHNFILILPIKSVICHRLKDRNQCNHRSRDTGNLPRVIK